MFPVDLIVRIILFTICSITIPYLSSIFWKSRSHFIISARFPRFTLIIVFSAYAMLLVALIGSFLDLAITNTLLDLFLSATNGGLSYLICAVLMYRLYLVYQQWLHERNMFDDRFSIISTSSSIPHIQNHCYHLWDNKKYMKLILLFQFVLLCIPIRSIVYVRMVFWTIWLVMSCILLFKSRNIREILFIKTETWIFIVLGLTALLVYPLYLVNVISAGVLKVMMYTITFVTAHVFLCVPLYYIHSTKETTHGIATDTRLPRTDTQIVEMNSNPQNDASLPLQAFLNTGKANYNEFAGYLTKTFALENLLYLVKVLRFRHSAIRMKQTTENDTEIEDAFWKIVFAMNFDYLMDEEKRSVESMHKYAVDIYKEFICDNGAYVINISSPIRNALHEYFAKNRNERGIEDYSHIFNRSIQEIFDLLSTVYSFQFRFKNNQW